MSKLAAAFLVSMMVAASAQAQSWLGAIDAAGCTWARVKIVNNSASDSNWAVWNGRTAVASTISSAETDSHADWDGVAEANSTEYVWVYGFGIGEVNISNSDGGASSFVGVGVVDAAGDSELVITIAADGTTTVETVATDAYEAPAQTGSMPVDE